MDLFSFFVLFSCLQTLEEVFLKIAGDNDVYSVPKVQGLDNKSLRSSNESAVSLGYDFRKLDESNDVQVEIKDVNDEALTTSLTDSSKVESGNGVKGGNNNGGPSKIEEFKIDQDIIDSLCKFQRPQLSSCELSRIHVSTLMKKRFRASRRDLRAIITQCIMPLLSLLFGLSLIKSFDTVSTSQPTLDIQTTGYQSPLIMPYNKNANSTGAMIINQYSNDVDTMKIPGVTSLELLNNWIVNETYKKDPYNIDALYTALYVDSTQNTVTFLYDNKATHC